MPKSLGNVTAIDDGWEQSDGPSIRTVYTVTRGNSVDLINVGPNTFPLQQPAKTSGSKLVLGDINIPSATGSAEWLDSGQATYPEFNPAYQTPQPQSDYEPLNNEVISTNTCEIDRVLLSEKPSSPMLLHMMDGIAFGVPILNLTIDTALYISVAYTKVRIVFKNILGRPVTGVFVLPTEGTVTTISARTGDDKFVESSYISKEEAVTQGFAEGEVNADDPTESYMPGCFRLQLPEIPDQTAISISVEILEDLTFLDQRYHFRFPLTFREGIAPPGISPERWLSISAHISCILPNIRYGSDSYNLTLRGQKGNMTSLSAMTDIVRDFHLSYSTPSPDISSATLYAPPERNEQGCFVSIINPPSTNILPMPRDIIFLFDRSGSMSGEPWAKGARAIQTALGKLNQIDRFGIVCFDDQQEHFSVDFEIHSRGLVGGLFPATASNIDLAGQWIQQHQARGLTDIKTPLQWAIDVLNSNNQESNRMQFVVLVTDGAVSNEHEIVQSTEQQAQDIRVLTFGIGRYCNWYFLKMLALKTRGWSSGAVVAGDIDERMNRLIGSANVPVLRDVELDISTITHADLYPPRIPDLFAGKPIVIAGVVTGPFPPSLQVTGIMPNGYKHKLNVRTESAEASKGVPVRKIFVKQQIDQIVAEYWLKENQKLKTQLINISIEENMPTPYSQMVAFEVTQAQKQELDRHREKTGGKGWSGKKIAAAGAGVVVVGTGAFLLGNVAATAAGAPSVLDGFDGGLFGAGDGDCGDCGECGECCEGLEDCGDGIGDALGDCCEGIGDCCEDFAEGVRDCCAGLGDMFDDCDCDDCD